MDEKTPKTEPKALECPKCGCTHLPVYRTIRKAGMIKRQRKCRHCGRMITTREKIS